MENRFERLGQALTLAVGTALPPVPATGRPGFEDRDLIARVLATDDRNAFAELVRRHQSALRASLRRMTSGNDALADDIAQETFLLAWKNIRAFRFEAKFSTWLYRIAFNAWQSEVRKKHEITLGDANMHLAETANPGETSLENMLPDADRIGIQRDLARAMTDLTDSERAAIHQCYANDLSHDEAAYVLGIPLGTLKTHILRAKDKMRGRLAAYAPEQGCKT